MSVLFPSAALVQRGVPGCPPQEGKKSPGTLPAHAGGVGKTGAAQQALPEELPCLFPEPLLDSGCTQSSQLILSGMGGRFGVVLLGWAGFP